MNNRQIAIRKAAIKKKLFKRFGRLFCVDWIRGKTPLSYILKCDCGNVIEREGAKLFNVRSCGCLRSDKARERATTHGLYYTRAHGVWNAMKQRCLNPKDKDYPDYGGRGITVCARWLKFENFYEDLGEIPEGLTLERRDNTKGYAPDNVELATWTEQALNRRPKGEGRKAKEKMK